MQRVLTGSILAVKIYPVMERRNFLYMLAGAGLVAGGVALDRALGRSDSGRVFGPQVDVEPPDAVDLVLFESGKTFSTEILKDQEKLAKIIEISNQFPVVSASADKDRQTPIKKIPLEIDSAQLVKARANKISLLTAFGESVGIILDLKENVFLGYDFDMVKRGGTPYPAFIAIIDRDNPSSRSIKPTSTFQFFGNDLGRDPITGIFVTFYATVDEVSGKDFCIIFNRGVFRHQTETAMIIPQRFNITFTGDSDRPSIPLPTVRQA